MTMDLDEGLDREDDALDAEADRLETLERMIG